MKKSFLCIAVILLFTMFMIMACSNANKGPAELAIKAAEEAVNTAKTEIGKIAPDEIASLESALASAKEKLSKGEYKEALAEAQGLVTKAKDVVAAAKAKKDIVAGKASDVVAAAADTVGDLTKKWTDLSQGLPKMVEAIQNRVDILSKSKKLPAGLTVEKLAEAKSGLASVKEDWAKAQESF